MGKRVLIWLRNDLRLHDHEPLYDAVDAKAQIVPLYCIDPRQFEQTSFGFPKTGAHRARFLLESLADLKQSLQSRGSDLVVRQGQPETVIPDLVKAHEIDAIYYHREATAEECAVEHGLKDALEPLGTKLVGYWGATLYHPDDLPFSVSRIPEVFTQFRKAVEKDPAVNAALATPAQLPPLPEDLSVGDIPTLADLGLEAPEPDPRSVMYFAGGETAGMQRLHNYFWQGDHLKRYKETRNGMLGADYSSKFSPWLAMGCLSPRYIHDQVQNYEEQRSRNDSTYWLVFELLWRDYFRFICAKHGDRIFYPSGLQGISIPWKQDWERFERWQNGETGIPLVDANMRELKVSGFMSNRGRQNVASFLTKNLGIDWRMGAEWFESLLIDYDVCSNYGNWNYTAGVGNDARGFRYFNIPVQASKYDAQGKYVKHWLPELADIPANKVHEPWTLNREEQKRYGVTLGVDYPNPVVDLQQSVKTNERIYTQAIGRS